MFNGIWLAVLGILGASSLIISRRPDAAQMIAKLAPYQGWIGAVSALWGVWGVISCVLNIAWMTSFPIYWFTWLADSVLQALLGLLLGVGVLKTFIKDPTANQKMDETITKIAPFQGTLGLAAIGLGIWMIVASFLFAVT
ncbi:MAG: hypothetical protein U0234_04710 [Sandaracinus sp.]